MNQDRTIFEETMLVEGGSRSIKVVRSNNVRFLETELYAPAETDTFFLTVFSAQAARAALTAQQVADLISTLQRALEAKRQDPQVVQPKPSDIQL
jgi:hypothetical protein